MVAFILGLALKSALVAATALGLAALFAARPASERATILRVAVCLLLALPVIALAAPDIPLRLLSPAAVAEPGPVLYSGEIGPVRGVSLKGDFVAPPPLSPLVPIWILGALLVFGRFLIGLMTLFHWTRAGRPVVEPGWRATLDRLAPAPHHPGRRPRLVCAPQVQSPLSWGLPPGSVLIGRADLARPQDAEAVLAHELAHIQRRDWLFLALSRLALALFWFNPLVWHLHASLAEASEEAADALAVRCIDRQAYARVLVDLAAHPTPLPLAAVGIAGPARSLKKRIRTLMTAPRPVRPRPLVLALTLGALFAVATPLAAIEIANRDEVPEGEVASAPVAQADAPAASNTTASWTQAQADAPTAPRTTIIYGYAAAPPPPIPPLPPRPVAPPAPPAPAWSGDRAVAAPPTPPAPPAFAPQAPTPPTAPRAPRAGSQSSRTFVYRSEAEMDPATRAVFAQARLDGERARRDGERARRDGDRARAHAERARAVALADRDRALEHAAHALAEARVQMRAGADQMDVGARQMRDESARLRDPAYRARQIAQARERGETVTDERLRALSPQLARQADDLEAQAERLGRQNDEI